MNAADADAPSSSPAASLQIASSAELPGWFGKLPGMGDFAHRRLPHEFRATWDPWLQRGLARLRDRHADWTAHYLEAPVWCFALGPRVAGDKGWIGVLMPSVDGVGRYFPFTVAVELDEALPERLQGEALAAVLRWWALATQAALEGLEGDLDAERFDAVLLRLFGPVTGCAEERAVGIEVLELPLAGASLWLADPSSSEGGLRVISTGLPRDLQFEAFVFRGWGMRVGMDMDAVLSVEAVGEAWALSCALSPWGEGGGEGRGRWNWCMGGQAASPHPNPLPQAGEGARGPRP